MKKYFYKIMYVSFIFLFFICAVGLIDQEIVSAASWTTQTQAPSNVADDGYTVIQNEKQLAYLINNISATGKYRLERNMNMSGYTWPGIQKTFKGTFDGAGFIIENITAETKTNHGLFSSLSGATVKNLGLNNCTFKGYSSVGAIAASTSGATVIEKVILTDCKVELHYSTSGYWPNVGGVVGIADGTTKIRNVFNHKGTNGYVKSNVSNTGSKDIYMGGIVGLAKTSVTVQNCLNESTITNTGKIASGQGLYTGGIAGFSYCAISGCGNTGVISSGNSSVGASYAGGIAGYCPNTISDCYNRGDVTSTATESNANSTGLSGTSRSEFFNVEAGFFKKKYVMYVSSSVTAEGKKKVAYAGGIVGYCNKAITRAYSTGTITGGGQYLQTALTYKFEVDIYDKQVFGGYKYESNYVTRTSTVTAIRCKPYAAPICGNTDNTSDSTTYYTGTVQCNLNGTNMVEAWKNTYNKLSGGNVTYMNNANTYYSMGFDGKMHLYMNNEDVVYWCGLSTDGYIAGGIGIKPKKTEPYNGCQNHTYNAKNTGYKDVTLRDSKYSTKVNAKSSTSIKTIDFGTSWATNAEKNGGYPHIAAIYW